MALGNQGGVGIFILQLRPNITVESYTYILEHSEELHQALKLCEKEKSLSPLLKVTPGELTTRRCLILSYCLPRLLVGPGVAGT